MYNLIGEKMRLRNVKGAKEEIEKSKYIIKDSKQYKGSFNKLFNNNNELHIEIGMGKGDFIINMALKYPNINFIGIEKYDSVIVRALQKLEEKEIKNLKLIRMDALEINEVFEKEIECIYLNFSDPWPKERHEKRRLTSDTFLKKYDDILKTKKIIMKTDNRKLFEYSVKSITNYGYIIDEISLDLHNDDIKDNVETEYEKKFVSLGNVIYRLSVHK
jgi:tRNA (guanine-N7-)-methyltransferase